MSEEFSVELAGRPISMTAESNLKLMGRKALSAIPGQRCWDSELREGITQIF